MTAILNASTSSGVVITSDNSGNIVIQSNGSNAITTAGANVTVAGTLTATGGIVQGANAAPTFYVTSSGTTYNSNTWTKITLDTEVWDTNNNFASSKFTPTVAGYYQINGWLIFNNAQVFTQLQIYKNGSSYASPVQIANSSGCYISNLVYCNGSTDYIELYGYSSGTTQPGGGGMSGFLARSA